MESILGISAFMMNRMPNSPWLFPDLINRAFGPGFNEEDKNSLMEEAKYQATQMADNLVRKMRSEIQNLLAKPWKL